MRLTCNRDELIKFNSFTRAVTQICKPFILARRCAPHVPTLGSGGRAGARRGGAARRLAAARGRRRRQSRRRAQRAPLLRNAGATAPGLAAARGRPPPFPSPRGPHARRYVPRT